MAATTTPANPSQTNSPSASPSLGLGQAFLAAIVAFGRARDMGLPPGDSIQTYFCPQCQRQTDHLVEADQPAVCIICGH